MEHSTSAPNERVWRITQLATLSFNHPSVVLTADVFQYFCKTQLSGQAISAPPSKSVAREIPINTQYPKSIARTIPINKKSPKLRVQIILIGRQSPKSIARTIQINCASYWPCFVKCFRMIHIWTQWLGGVKTSYVQTYNTHQKSWFIPPFSAYALWTIDLWIDLLLQQSHEVVY